MVSKQVIQVLIEAEEEVSKVAKKAENAINKMGSVGSKAMEKINNVSSKVGSAFSKLHGFVDKAREKFNQFKNSSDKIGALKTAVSNVANSFGQLITNSNTASMAMNKIKSVADGIQAKFTGLQGKIRNFGSSVKSSLTSAFSFSGIKQKLSSLGSSIDNLKVKLKSLANEAKKTGGSGGLGFLKNAASMTVGMLGYDLVNSMMESARASLNARSSVQAFAQRLNMSGTEVTAFQKSLDDLQSTYKKIDMDVVGQQATDMAFRLGLPKTALAELTETTAIFNDAMMRNGRSSEDAMMAMADAMDGQFVRLKEIGISREDLMKDGWSGDINDKTGLLKAMNKSLKEQHYDELAKSVDTLDDAWQALSVTLGNLLESILLPLTPVIVGIVTALTSAVDGIKGFITSLQTAFSGLPEWAQIGIAIAAVAVGVGIAIAAFGGLEAIILSLAGAIAPVIAVITAISWPIVAVVAAIGLLVAAIYEVGKAFGWWSDVGTMFEAISNNVHHLWDAFINHPDVQATIAAISTALKVLGDWITQAGQAIMEFFGISTGSEWDVTRAIIDGIGVVWQMLTAHIRAAIAIIQAVIGAFQYLYDGAVNLGSYLSDVLAPAFTFLSELWNSLVEAVQPIVDIFQQFQDGQVGLVDVISTVASSLWTVWTTLSSALTGLILQLVSNLLTWAIQAGLNVLTGIQTYLSQVPGKVWQWLGTTTLGRVIQAGALWVQNARAKASQLVNGVVSFLRQLPGRAYSVLLQVVSRIISAGQQWVSNARSKASEVVSNVVSTLSGLPDKISGAIGGVVDAITKPFRDAYTTLTGIVDDIKNKASEVGNIILPFGGDLPMGGDISPSVIGSGSVVYDVNGNTSGSDILTVDINQNVTLDLVNVPAQIDTPTLIRMLNNKDVLNSLVTNRDFQSLDAKVKERINYKVNRSRGI